MKPNQMKIKRRKEPIFLYSPEKVVFVVVWLLPFFKL